MDDSDHFFCVSAGGYTVSSVIDAPGFARIRSGAECWITVRQAQSRDEAGRVLDFGDISVLFPDGALAERMPHRHGGHAPGEGSAPPHHPLDCPP